MALSPGLGLKVFMALGLDTESPVPTLTLAATVLLIMLSSQFCVSSSASWPICIFHKILSTSPQ